MGNQVVIDLSDEVSSDDRDFDQSLSGLWDAVGDEPFDAEREDDKGRKFHCKGFTPTGNAYGWYEDDRDKVVTMDSDELEWREWREPGKMVPHWPGVCGDLSQGFWVTDSVYPSLEEAKDDDSDIVRLAKELPCLMLPKSQED